MLEAKGPVSSPSGDETATNRFGSTPEQQQIRDSAVAFAQQELSDDVVTRDYEGTFNREFWRKCADYGVFAMGNPDGYGEIEGLDFERLVHLLEGLGYGCRDNGFVFAVSAQIVAIQHPIARFGSDFQKAYFLPKLCSGEWIGAHALTEIQSGSDVYNVQTQAEKCEGGYRLSGKKRLITLAPIADLFIAYANTNPELGKWGITAFLVERSSAGVIAHPTDQKMGLRTVPFGEVSFEDCFVPDAHVLGKVGAGLSISTACMETERCAILSSQLGAMERQLEETVAYANETRRFGKSIGSFQSVSNRIAAMKLRLETARLLLYKVAWLKAHNQPAGMESALVKLHLSECFLESSLDAIRNFGGNGYLTETGIERNLRDSIGPVIYAGTSDLQRLMIARMLGLSDK